MKKLIAVAGCVGSLALSAQSQVLLSGGLTYSQNFDTLSGTPVSSTNTMPWADNSTLVGWYASRATTTSGGAYGPYSYPTYRVSGGELTSGWIYSYGTNGVGTMADRAFGTLSSGTPATNAIGLRLQNDTTSVLGNVTLSYTGELWRDGGNTSAAAQTLPFTFRVGSTPITDPAPGNENGWLPFTSLDFVTPSIGTVARPVDGNDSANRVLFSNIILTGVNLNPGEELFLRWCDRNDSGNDHAFGIDDLKVTFSVVPEPSSAALGLLGLTGLALWRRVRRA